MSSGPTREYHLGNRGPDYHVESKRKKRHGHLWDRPRAHAFLGAAPMPVGRIEVSRGRDPHDTVTRELPLEPWPFPGDYAGPLIDDRVYALLDSPGDLRECAEVAFDLAFPYLCWLYLMEQEVRT